MMRSDCALFSSVFVLAFLAAPLFLMSGGLSTADAACPTSCPGEPGTPCGNGDVNADGNLDISDAIHLLVHLFAGGPQPETLPCGPETPVYVPATGQTVCYDTQGTIIECDREDLPGQDGSYRAGQPLENRFLDHENGTLTDNYTDLMWKKVPAEERMNWQQALLYCENLVLCADGTWLSSTQAGWTPDSGEIDEHGGILHDDWRLPNIKELQSLFRYDPVWPASSFGPNFDLPVGNAQTFDDWFYWSSTTWSEPGYGEYALTGNYMGGVTAYRSQGLKTYAGNRVLAVRAAR